MKAQRTVVSHQSGFTLIEMIVTIVVAAILGATFLQIMGTSMTGSVEPLIRVQDQFIVKETVERMTADYDTLKHQDPDTLDTVKSRIGNEGAEVVNGDYGNYKVERNAYIIFTDEDGDGDYEERDDDGSGGYRILKVTVSSGDERLTSLFIK
jgi:prepilin-type N-terminal cleavage/methylation domain-containing protein